MAEPKISVLIPTFSQARFLGEAIDSVLLQDWQDFELVIADNASTDESAGLISRYAKTHARIRAHVHYSNIGAVNNFNWCLAQATGEYIKFVLADDKLASPQALRTYKEMLDRHPTAALAASARQLLDQNSCTLGINEDFHQSGLHAGASVIARCLSLGRNLIGEPSAVIFRRQAAVRGFNGNYHQLPDLEMWFALLEQGDFVYTPEPLCCFRSHDQQLTALYRQSGRGAGETDRLFWEYHRRPYLAGYGMRQILFDRLYGLNRQSTLEPQLQELRRSMGEELGKFRYAAYWLRRKVIRPFAKLGCWFAKRRSPELRTVRNA